MKTIKLLGNFQLLLFLVLGAVSSSFATANSINGWLEGDFNSAIEAYNAKPIIRSSDLPRTGGQYWHRLELELHPNEQQVVDFASTSVIGEFQHALFDSQGFIVWGSSGGIRSEVVNPYLLRHGRNLPLFDGRYTLMTRVKSDFLLAHPIPVVFNQDDYSSSIKIGNTIVLSGLGIFFGLGFYYLALGMVRRQATDFLYSLFILGNFIYNGSALLFFSDVIGWKSFYSVSLPIMFTNLCYIGFVMKLLNISKNSAPKLYQSGCIALAIVASFWLIVPFTPQLSLEFARIGVGLFALFGLASGIIMWRAGSRIAFYYLIANIFFIVPALISILLNSLPNSTLLIEHIGLLAVAIEVLMLALVLSYQINIVYKEKAASLMAAEESLNAANKAVQSKERFLANISHELRTPLNAITGSVELLDEYPRSQKEHEQLNTIRHSSDFLLFLINDILDLTKLNADKMQIDQRPVNIHHTIKSVFSVYEQTESRKKTSIHYQLLIEDSIPEWIIADDQRIEQILANLLSNAFKFTDQGSIALKASLSERKDRIIFTVSDTGIGIAKDKLDDIFSEFTQADASISRRYGGSGLGLRIAMKLADLMGGKLFIESKLSEGSSFSFDLPFTACEAPRTQGTHADLPLSLRLLNGVVVDDNAVNLKVMAGLLKKLGAKIDCFNNAVEAIPFIIETQPHFVIMDVQMPDVDGIQATQQLRDSNYEKPIIAYTANASEQDQLDCLNAGMDDIMVKPVHLKDIIHLADKWQHQMMSD